MTGGAEIVQGADAVALLDDGEALAAVEVVRASRVPAARIRAAPRPNRLCATVIVPPSWADLQPVRLSFQHATALETGLPSNTPKYAES